MLSLRIYAKLTSEAVFVEIVPSDPVKTELSTTHVKIKVHLSGNNSLYKGRHSVYCNIALEQSEFY